MNKPEHRTGRHWLLPCIVLLIIGVLVTAVCLALSEQDATPDPLHTNPTTHNHGISQSPDPTEPNAETQGTFPVTEPVDGTQPSTEPPAPDATEPVTSSTAEPEKQLVCRLYSFYRGAYVEDGSDEPVENVAALLISNGSDRYLDLAQLIYDLDGREAIFTVTGLPAGASAWVLEANRMSADAGTTFTHKNTLTSFRDDAVNDLEGLELSFNGTMLKATNTTDQPFKNVAVYYKTLHEDGNFLGGITYMTVFGDLEPGQSAEKIAGHFHPDQSQIVRIGYTV